MLKTSGLMLDVHDDIGGEVLKSFFPTHDAIPETIKQAHALTQNERDLLPDDDFALVMIDGDQKLRKFACIDEGNTRLAVLYFAANHHKLPEEAQKTAAANLVTACGWYDIEVPEEIEKVAIGLATGLSLLSAPATIKGVHGQVKQNLSGIRAQEAAGHTVVPPNEAKHAEVSNTPLMPGQQPSDRSVKPSKTTVLKSASIGHLVKGDKREHQNFGPEETDRYDGYTKGRQPQQNPQAKAMKPHVDVSNHEPTKILIEKGASRYALEDGRYPLDSYEQVKAAAVYFEEYGKRFSPAERHEYCVNLVKRASELNLPVSYDARKYGSEEYASQEEIKAAFDARRNALLDDVEKLVLSELEEKRAMIEPVLFCTALEEFDKIAGLDHYYDSYVPDPFYSIFGVKEAEAYSFVHGNDMITENDLVRFGKTMHKSLKNSFGADFSDEFCKDPVGIFKSLPLTQKKMIMHLATNNAPGAEVIA